MIQKQVLHAILTAHTREEVAQARQMRDEWVKAHPDDIEVFEASERLEMLAEAHTLIDAEGQTSS